jgi:Cu(I)/Ag(I) efflux system membrane fusion protein
MVNEPPSRASSHKKIVYVLIAVIFFALGFWFRGLGRHSNPEIISAAGQKEEVWTCSMHPQIRLPKPGQCPICLMDLILLEGAESETAGAVISFSPSAVHLMEIETAVVERKPAQAQIRLVGKLDYDQIRVKSISAWTAGRIDRLFVDYTGMQVRKGDHMAELYSPDLISAQAELLGALQSAGQIESGSSLVRQSADRSLQAARDKLRLLGVTAEQIALVEKTGQVLDHLTIYAPIGGVVIDKAVAEGMYVQTASPIYTIADLSALWLMLDAYESDLAWLHYGQTVEFTTEAYPGRVFEARISFISPTLDPKTRTARVRATVDNADGLLKPELFVRAVVKASLTEEGRAMSPDLEGKWICPMHGDVVRDQAGKCDICQMDLVGAETLYAPAGPSETPLVIPAGAVLITGQNLDRAVVYVQVEGQEKPTFIGREIVLGPRAGDEYIVREGLMEGERVVSRGAFKIDSSLQIQARPSMMTTGQMAGGGEVIEQTHCPIMGGPIDKNVFIEYQGKKVYFCCPGCEETFLKDPEKYLDKLPQFRK